MKTFLINNKVPKASIVRICSEADTHGNLRAIYKRFNNELKDKIVGILTNFYHIPRVMRFIHDPKFDWNAKFVPICAESVVTSTSTNYLSFAPQLLRRISNEIKGLKDWESNNYRDQNKPEKDWVGKIHLNDRTIAKA